MSQNEDYWSYRGLTPCPTITSGSFLRDYGYEPAQVIKWDWSGTFGKWTALVRFVDGYESWTYLEPDWSLIHADDGYADGGVAYSAEELEIIHKGL